MGLTAPSSRRPSVVITAQLKFPWPHPWVSSWECLYCILPQSKWGSPLEWNSSHLINCCCHKSNQFCTRSPNMVDDSRSRGCKQCIAEEVGGDGRTLADLWKAENRFPGPVGPPTTFVGGEKLNNKLSNEVELESAAIALYFPAHPGSIMAAPSTFIINHHCNMLK